MCVLARCVSHLYMNVNPFPSPVSFKLTEICATVPCGHPRPAPRYRRYGGGPDNVKQAHKSQVSTSRAHTVAPNGLPRHPSETSRQWVTESSSCGPRARCDRSHCSEGSPRNLLRELIAQFGHGSTLHSIPSRHHGLVDGSRWGSRGHSAGSARVGRTSRSGARDLFELREYA